MNWNIIEGKWKETVGHARERWGDLTDDELLQVEGKKERLGGLLQQRYGLTQDAALLQIDDWSSKLKDIVKD